MNRLPVVLLLAALATAGAADLSSAPGDEVAQRLTAVSIKQEVAAGDPRVAPARRWLDQAVKRTGEEPATVAAACSRYAGHLFDALHVAATPLELLEALATFGQAGRPMNDTLQTYVSARKASPLKSHAEAMAALARSR